MTHRNLSRIENAIKLNSSWFNQQLNIFTKINFNQFKRRPFQLTT